MAIVNNVFVAAWRAADEFSGVDFYYEKHRHPTRVERFLYTVLAFLDLLRGEAQCKLTGHDLIDDDPGDPEVGPQPNVYCRRCRRHWS